MAIDRKKTTLDALNKFSQRQLDEGKPREIKHHGKPEKEVEKACLIWMRNLGWSVNVFEAKANWSTTQGAWVQQGMKAGTCDCLGSDSEGIGIAIEFKAPGAMSSFNSEKRYLQRKFIVDKINANVFACVVDSVERLELIYFKWNELRASDKGMARTYLLSMLPQKSLKTRLKDETLFDDE